MLIGDLTGFLLDRLDDGVNCAWRADYSRRTGGDGWSEIAWFDRWQLDVIRQNLVDGFGDRGVDGFTEDTRVAECLFDLGLDVRVNFIGTKNGGGEKKNPN